MGTQTEYWNFSEPADHLVKIEAEATDATLCYLYWMVRQSSPSSSGGSCCEMQLQDVELTVPFPIFSTKIANLKANKTVNNMVTIRLPMLVNEDAIAKGSQIVCAGLRID